MILETKRSKQVVRETEEMSVNSKRLGSLGRTSRGLSTQFQSLTVLFAGRVAKGSKDLERGLRSPRLGRGERESGDLPTSSKMSAFHLIICPSLFTDMLG